MHHFFIALALIALASPRAGLAQNQEALRVLPTELADFKAAEAAMEAGDYAAAAKKFKQFRFNYPGGPLSDKAGYMQGKALESADDLRGAARAYLNLLSNDPTGPLAPDALFRLGRSLDRLGQIDEACKALGEVETRFPESGVVIEAKSAMQNMGCQ